MAQTLEELKGQLTPTMLRWVGMLQLAAFAEGVSIEGLEDIDIYVALNFLGSKNIFDIELGDRTLVLLVKRMAEEVKQLRLAGK